MDGADTLPSLSWFIGTASLSVLAWAGGTVLGRQYDRSGRSMLYASVAVLFAWVWLMRRQDVAVTLLPVSVLSRLEGVAAAPIFMLIVGIAWGRAELSRQRHIAAWAAVVGAVYFLQGGWWMVQPNPALGTQRTQQDVVLQSRDYTCVAASCATVLTQFGVRTSEEEMARLTDTRPGSGSTMMRALAGLEQRLIGEGLAPALISVRYEDLHTIPTPAMTALQYRPRQRHMVAILEVLPGGVLYADPMSGMEYATHSMFRSRYRGTVIVITPDAAHERLAGSGG